MGVHDDDAVSSVYQFSVGGAVLVVCVSFLLSAAGFMGGDRSAADAAVDEARASSLRQVAMSSSWSWDEGEASLPNGLQTAGGALDLAALTQFKQASWEASNDGRVGYSEARGLWGVDERDGFHMRVTPLPASGLFDFSGLRVGYVGAWTDVGELHVELATDAVMVAGFRAQLDTAMAAQTATERAVLNALGVDFDNRVRLTAAGPALLVDTFVPLAPPAGKAYVCHSGNTILIDLNAVLDHKLHGDSVGYCPGQTPPGNVVSVPLLSILGDFTLLEGDVYLDDVDYLDGAMASRWSDYDVIVVGSNAAPQALGQGGFPAGLAAHVQSGGLLVLFGGTSNDAWIAPTAAAIAATANQEPATPDLQHPLLAWPYPVDWQALAKGPGLAVARFPDATWQHVLPGIDLLLSPLGAYPDGGLVVATSMQPDGTAGTSLATNILAYYARQDLHLDFGMSRPADQSVAGAMATVWGEDLGGNQVPLRVQFLYWRG